MTAAAFGGANLYGACTYAANYLVFGAPDIAVGAPYADGTGYAIASTLRMQGEATLDRSFPDGTSSTILFAERYSSCSDIDEPKPFSDMTNTAFGNYANLWADATNRWRTAFCVNYRSQIPSAVGYTRCLMFQDTPDPNDECFAERAQTPHPGMMNVSLADGSVRGLSATMSIDTWVYACDPRDREILSSDWDQ